MKKYSEIYEIITEKLGIKNLKDYQKYSQPFEDKDNPKIPTQEEIDLLDPDTIDNRDFWLVAEKIFGTDAVSNCGFKELFSKDQANKNNLGILYSSGFISLIDFYHRFNSSLNVLEIGPGYGGFKNYIQSRTNFNYFGADVYPKIEGIDQNNPNGLLSDQTLSRKYNLILSSNVFQHLSVNQRRAYYRDVSRIASPNFVFMFNMWAPKDLKGVDLDSKGRAWTRHYGQFTQIQTIEEVFDDLRLYFKIQAYKVTEKQWVTFELVDKS